MRKLVLMSMLALPLFACGETMDPAPQSAAGESPAAQAAEGLTIDQWTPTRFVAEVHDATYGTLLVDSGLVDPGHAIVRVTINEKLFEADVNQNTGQLVVDGHDQMVSEDDHEVILRALADLSLEIGTDDPMAPPHIQHIGSLLNFLGDALPVYDINRIETTLRVAGDSIQLTDDFTVGDLDTMVADGLIDDVLNKRDGNDGISCVAYNHYFYAEYRYAVNWFRNQTRGYNMPVVGSYTGGLNAFECHGRCGPGCESAPGNGGAWTLDCLEHDACVYDMYGESPSFGDNTLFNLHCKNEFTDATSDYFASWSTCPGTTMSGQSISDYRGAITNWWP